MSMLLAGGSRSYVISPPHDSGVLRGGVFRGDVLRACFCSWTRVGSGCFVSDPGVYGSWVIWTRLCSGPGVFGPQFVGAFSLESFVVGPGFVRVFSGRRFQRP